MACLSCRGWMLLVCLLSLRWQCRAETVSISLTPSPSPTVNVTTPPEEDDDDSDSDPVKDNLAVIIGVPVGVGLSLIGLLACVIWLACSSYIEYRKNRPDASGTHTTHLRTSKGVPMEQAKSGSAGNSGFEPEPDDPV